ncbi:MAG TPA: dolichol-phosphate mannosyltransferase [Clostridiales bacterium]|nr:dolichol-phosphate mannosyltransferase [Clostridiales bacterium]
MKNHNNEKAIILIPSLEPDRKLLAYVNELKEHGLTDVIIIDDGSGEYYQPIFCELTTIGCVVLHHPENYGKGCALKTGFKYIQENYDWFSCVVTVDSDGQHAVKDVLRILEISKKNPDTLSLGIRDFSMSGIPVKSLLGNRFVSFVFALLYGRYLSDTQTGLRAFGIPLLEFMLDVKGERFEYEMKMLIACVQAGISIEMIPIQVIYIDSNEGTHFKPILDSVRVVGTILSDFFRFSVSSIVSAAVDLGIAWLLLDFLHAYFKSEYLKILIATSVARVISTVLNYLLNRNFVFREKSAGGRSLIRYLMLCAVIIIFSTTGVYVLYKGFGINEKIGKVICDTLLYFLSYQVQQRWVFK